VKSPAGQWAGDGSVWLSVFSVPKEAIHETARIKFPLRVISWIVLRDNFISQDKTPGILSLDCELRRSLSCLASTLLSSAQTISNSEGIPDED
jgi:hypothetical protein